MWSRWPDKQYLKLSSLLNLLNIAPINPFTPNHVSIRYFKCAATAQPRIDTWKARRAFFHLENARGRYGCMKHSLWPKKSSWKNNSNDTKNEMENRILPSVVLSAKFCKKHRCISGPLEHIIKKTPGTQRVRSSYRKHCWSGRGHLSHEVRMGTP